MKQSHVLIEVLKRYVGLATKSVVVVCHMLLLLFGLMTRAVRMCLSHPALSWRSLTQRLREERLLSGECLAASCSARSDQKH